MKKLLYLAIGKPALVDEAVPCCPPGGLLLRTIYSGVSNGTERNQMLGGNYNISRVFPFRDVGYQTVSEVVDVSAGVRKFRKGDIVATGTSGTHAEYHTAPEDGLVVPLPSGFDLLVGAFVSVAAVALHIVRRAGVAAGERVLITGAGLIGQFALQWCKCAGAHVSVLSRTEPRTRLAEQLGADVVGFGDDGAQDRFLATHQRFAVVIETTGSATLLRKVIGENWGEGVFVRGCGRLAVVAGNWEVTYSCNAAQGAELALVHTNHFTLDEQREVVDRVHHGELKIRPLIREIVPAVDIIRVYEALRDRPGELLGTVIDWR